MKPSLKGKSMRRQGQSYWIAKSSLTSPLSIVKIILIRKILFKFKRSRKQSNWNTVINDDEVFLSHVIDDLHVL